MVVQVGLLGEVTVHVDGQAVELGPARQRCVLAALAVDAPRLVPVDSLVERVWGARTPRRGRETLHSYISRLRQALSGVGALEVVSRSGGYALLSAQPGQVVDLHQFHELRGRARADDAQAAALLTEALALWRGEALTGLTGDWVETERERLRRERWNTECDLTDRLLDSTGDEDLVARLSARVTAQPLDERVAGQYLLALHRAGQSADALAYYQRLRQRLVRELGTDPGAPLQELHQRILTADPALAAAPATAPSVPSVVPRQLPAPPTPFVGRGEELDRLDAILRQAGEATLAIGALSGAGGFGKTWLALHWAHRHAGEFPDGQLFVDLRGFSPDEQPMPPAVAVRGFLDALGVDASRLPADTHAQAALFRSLVADKRMLVILDNAADADQAGPLLPGGAECAVIVTSRNQLTGLITGHGARNVRLDVLTADEAHAVLARRLGSARLDADPAVTDEVIAQCAGFPLALSLVAGHAHTRPDLPLAAIAAELRELDLGMLDDDTAGLSAVLSWSYRALKPGQATVFSLLGVAPGPDIGLSAAAALTGLSPHETRKAVLALEQASLVKQDSRGRLRMHDLIRRYAADTAKGLPGGALDAALRRLADFYLHTAYAGERLIGPHRPAIQLSDPEPGVRPQDLPDAESAFAWFDTEHPNLLAAQHAAMQHGRHQTVWQLAWTLSTFHARRGHSHDEVMVWQAGLAAGERLDSPAVHTLTRRLLGGALAGVGRFDEAIESVHQALALAELHHDHVNQVRSHRTLAWAWGRSGDDRKALEHATRALDLHRELQDPIEETYALCIVACYAAQLGEHDRAYEDCRLALDRCREHNLREGEASVLDTLGYLDHRTGHHRRAIRNYRESLARYRELGDMFVVAENLEKLGHPHAALGEDDDARTVWRAALSLYEDQRRDAEAERLRQRIDALGK
ncbi:AfsR/SARP family transcriptional regulator [Amycolatopsis oliviviridis]|nr:BTAD domain-containing putative transcriptional regulator [Amycolatopsis oliviviridis]